jgi:tetratricopeptide (TPR) repeat protein
VLDDLVGAHLLEQTAPDRFQFHDLLRAYTAGLVQTEESPEQRQAALRRVVGWYLHTAESARAWLRPTEEPVALDGPPPEVLPLDFTDYDAAADWSERELGNFLPVVRRAFDNGLDREAWQSAAVMWAARPHSSSEREGLELERLGIEAAERAGDPAAQTRLLLYMGISHRTLNRYAEGLAALNRAVDSARRSGLHGDEARALNLVGLIHLHKRELDPASAYFSRALSRFHALGDHHRAARVQSNLASVDLSAGRLAKAAQAVEEALPEHRRLGHRAGEGNLLRIRAALQLEQGDTDAARRSIDDALTVALDLRDHTLEGYWLLTLGDIQRAVGEYGEALTSYQRSAMLHRRLGDRRREALAWRGTGQTYTAMDRSEDAATFHHRALAIHRDLEDAWEQAVELDLLAAAVHREDPEAGRAHRREAVTFLAPYSDPRATAMRSAIERRVVDSG